MGQPLVLCYHGTSDEWKQPLAVRPRAFERQLQSLLRRGFRPVPAGEVLTGTGRLMHVTFDDAFRNVANVVPVLERLGVPATVFAASGLADEGRPLAVPELADEAAANPGHLATMTWDDLRALVERGLEIGSHTVSHPHLPELTDAELDRELSESRLRCEEELGRRCRFVAYPYGEHDERVRAAARRAGYEGGFSLEPEPRSDDPFALPRVHLWRRDSLARATLKTSVAHRAGYALARRLRHEPVPGLHSEHGGGWLAAALPADARRLRVADSVLASELAQAGAEIVERAPDVEIAPAKALRGDAPVALVALDAPPYDSAVRAVRLARRLRGALRTQLASQAARQAVSGRGYVQVEVFRWDPGRLFHAGAGGGPAWAVARLCQRAFVIGRRAGPEASLLDAVLAAAAPTGGGDLISAPPSIRPGGVIVCVGRDSVLRMAIGPARHQIEAQIETLRALRSEALTPCIADRIPWPLDAERAGLARWSLERRLAGAPATTLTATLLADAVDFLVALHAVGGGGPPATLGAAAETVAQYRPGAAGDALRRLGARLDDRLAGLPRGFGHADFFLGNLLAVDGRLAGAVDWDGGGPGRLPLLDLLHLRQTASHAVPDAEWGPALVRSLLPWARAGGDPVALDYCRRVGFEPEPALLAALVQAYWLDRVACQLRFHPHRRASQRWLARSIDHVLWAFTGGA